MRTLARGPIVVASCLVVGLLAATATPSLAWRVGVFVGPAVVPGPPVVIGAPVYAVPAYAPPVVVESPAAVPSPPAPQYWYYCQGSQSYYPYVQQCPGGWQPVSPTPQPAP
jgi:hypothetical protein